MAMAPQAPAPQGAPPQSQPGSAADLVQMVSQGLMGLKKLIDASGDSLEPEEKQEFAALVANWQAFVSEMSQAPGQNAPGPQAGAPQRGPMPANAAPGAKPSNY